MKKTFTPAFRFIAMLLAFSLFSTYNNVSAQEIDKKKCREFVEAPELYLINSNFNTFKFKTGKGEVFTFEELIEKNFGQKKIIKIDEKEYNKMKDVKNKFHIIFSTLIISKDGDERGNIDNITIRKGKSGITYGFLYWFQVNADEMRKGIAPERLIYAVNSLGETFKDCSETGERESYFYKSTGYKEVLKSDTLYLRKDHLDKNLTSQKIKNYYPYTFKLVSPEQWKTAIAQQRSNVLFIDLIDGGYYNAMKVFRANDGKLVLDSYPWIGHNQKVDPTVLKKLFR